MKGFLAVPKMLSGIIDPVFHNVTIRNITGDVATDYVDFIGLYSPKTIAGEDRTILFVGDENQLYYPNAAMIIGSCRAYFQLKGIEVGEGDESTTVRSFNMNFGEDHTNGITTTNYTNYTNKAGAWFDLSGRKLDGKPTKKGLYINNGKKVVIK